MTDKFELYDILGILIPGILLVYVFLICFPGGIALVPAKMSDTLNTLAFTAVSVFIGQMVQALASLAEPVLHWSFGGLPSNRALIEGLGKRYLSENTAKRIRGKLEKIAGDGATERELFFCAMQRADGANSARVNKFNALYAYHRALMVLALSVLLIIVLSSFFGALSSWNRPALAWLYAALLASLLLIWNRTRQRSFYYVKEVLSTAERVMDSAPAVPPASPTLESGPK